MEKTNEELLKLKQEYESITVKLRDLSNEELIEVTGGIDLTNKCQKMIMYHL